MTKLTIKDKNSTYSPNPQNPIFIAKPVAYTTSVSASKRPETLAYAWTSFTPKIALLTVHSCRASVKTMQDKMTEDAVAQTVCC